MWESNPTLQPSQGYVLSIERTTYWWTFGELNPRPPECKTGMLPLSLKARIGGDGEIRTHIAQRRLIYSQVIYTHLPSAPLVRLEGFEPSTSHSRSACSTKLSHSLLVRVIGFEPISSAPKAAAQPLHHTLIGCSPKGAMVAGGRIALLRIRLMRPIGYLP